MYTVFENDTPVYFDVDNTLVMHGDEANEKVVKFVDPYTGFIHKLVPNKSHIGMLKRCKGRGRGIVVWSHAGVGWAKSVVDTLGLQDYVDLIITKPEVYCDDVDIERWQFINIFLTKAGESPGKK